MKKTLKRLFLALTVALIGVSATAQNNKFGHIDFSELYAIMPGQDSVQIKYDAYKTMLQKQLTSMQTAYQAKVDEYQAAVVSGSDELILQTLAQDANDMEERIRTFSQNAQQRLMAKEDELTAPIIEAARKAVEEVAKANGYTYIFNSAEGLLLYAKESDDIMPLVKKYLGIE